MKIKIKLDIELRKGVCEGSWGSSVLDWQECWLKTEYKKGEDCPYVAYIYPTVWEYSYPKNAHKDGFMKSATSLKYLELREWIERCKEDIRSNNPLLLV